MKTQMPFLKEKPIFEKVANIASLAAMESDEFQSYMDSVDAYRTAMAAFAFSEMKGEARGIEIGEARGRAEGIEIGEARGRAEGRAEGRAVSNAEHITRMRSKGYSDELIADLLDLDIDFVRKQ